MKHLVILTVLTVILFGSQLSFAQDFLSGAHTFSGKKDSYFTLKDGTELTAKVDKIKRKKGLILSVKIELPNGEERILNAGEIDHMYLIPSGFDSFSKALNESTTMNKWFLDTEINQGYIQEGYVLFESAKFIIKKKEQEVLAQLLNPGYPSYAKVYFDPFAKETMRIDAGPLTVAGGDAKSYYIKVGDKPAYLLQKKDYKETIPNLYKNCRKLGPAFEDNLTWRDFAKHLYFYTTECQGV